VIKITDDHRQLLLQLVYKAHSFWSPAADQSEKAQRIIGVIEDSNFGCRKNDVLKLVESITDLDLSADMNIMPYLVFIQAFSYDRHNLAGQSIKTNVQRLCIISHLTESGFNYFYRNVNLSTKMFTDKMTHMNSISYSKFSAGQPEFDVIKPNGYCCILIEKMVNQMPEKVFRKYFSPILLMTPRGGVSNARN